MMALRLHTFGLTDVISAQLGFYLKSFAKSCLQLLLVISSVTQVIANDSKADFTELSLEDLMTMDLVVVTSASKKEQKLSDTAASVYVLSETDIRRSGATSVVDALRLVPGLHVARIDSNKWSVSARGFSGRFAGKMLVLVDGQSVLEPLFVGVFWDSLDVVLEDIDRIEVIRGSGGAIWGANAVTGVVNIITKPASMTQGSMVSLVAGSEENSLSIRQGGELERGHYRVFGKASQYDAGENQAGENDDWRIGHLGWRADWQFNSTDSLKIQGQVFDGATGQQALLPQTELPIYPAPNIVNEDEKKKGGNVLLRWLRKSSPDLSTNIQFFFNTYTHRETTFGAKRETFDIELNQHKRMSPSSEIVYGAGFRANRFITDNTDIISLTENVEDTIASMFIEGDFSLIPDKWNVQIGLKMERYKLEDSNYMPSIRSIYRLNSRQRIWGSLARTVEMPSIGSESIKINTLQELPSPPATQPYGTIPLLASKENSATLVK